MFDLKDKIIIITGSCGGIWKAMVSWFLAVGAKVIGVDIVSSDLIDDDYIHFVVDISDINGIVWLYGKLGEMSIYPNCLINNWWIYLAKDIYNHDISSIAKTIDVNLMGTIYMTKYFLEYIWSQNILANIINISSVSWQEWSSDPIYGASKAWILWFTKSMSLSSKWKFRINAIAPWLVQTAMMDNIPTDRLAEYHTKETISDPIMPKDVFDTALFLVSDMSSHYNGATFDLNNGCYLR